MIIVRFELHSAIDGSVSELARLRICNDGSGTAKRRNYIGYVFRGRSKAHLDRAIVQRQTRIADFPSEDVHVWNLVARMLKAMGYG